MKLPLVSVIMPVFNSAKFLKEAVDSVLNEKYSNIELLIYDDCSTDESPLILAKYADIDSRIRIFRGEKKSKNVAINYRFLVDKSHGSYFIPTDSDDVCLPDRLQILVESALENPFASLIFGRTRLVDENMNQTLGYRGKPVSPYDLFLGNFVPDGSSLISREHYDACGGYNVDIEWAEDYDLRLKLLEQGPFIYINEDVYLYRQHGQSWTAKKRDLKKERAFREYVKARNEKIVKRIQHHAGLKIYYSRYVAIKYLAAYYADKRNPFKAYRLLKLLDNSGDIYFFKRLNYYWLRPAVLFFYNKLGIKRKVKNILFELDRKTGYNDFLDKTVVTKVILKEKLLELGLRSGQKIIVHASLSNFGYVVGGVNALLDVLKDIIGNNGLIMMPTFTYYTESYQQKYFELQSPCSKDMGVIAETFRTSSGVHRNFHPFTSFAFWGKGSDALAEKYYMADSLSQCSPLGELLTDKAYVLMLGTDFSKVSILHTAEYLAEVPYSAYKSIFNYIEDGERKSIELRRTGHSNEFNKIVSYLDSDIINTMQIGGAICSLVNVLKLVEAAKSILSKAPDFFLCSRPECKTCMDRRRFL